MPVLVRKLLIIAAADGLLLHPQHPRGQKTVQLDYGHSSNLTAFQKDIPKDAAALETHGVVGLFTVSRSSFLISITGRKQVAQIKGKPIYVITGVALIPLTSQAEAGRAIEQAHRKENKPEDDISDSSDDELPPAEQHDEITNTEAEIERSLSSESAEQRPRSNSTVAADVIGRRGKYGRFADRWFSKAGWKKDTRRVQALNEEEETDTATLKGEAAAADQVDPDAAAAKEAGDPRTNVPLLPKLLKTTKMLLGSRSFFYSYDMDITRRLGTQEPGNDLPLHTKVDHSFFWNRHLLAPFTDETRGHGFALPVMQGFVGQKAFSVNTQSNSIADVKEDAGEVIELQDNASISTSFRAALGTKDFLITLISRRSVKRPGLRYLRRGIDDDGNVANYVETEQVISNPTWSPEFTTYSFTQVRGSIPLYFTQSPYSLKPVPVIQHSHEKNAAALKKHFHKIIAEYGAVQVACLIDKHGTEVKVGNAFQEHTEQYNEQEKAAPVAWNWFDFHGACRGMKFENVSILLDEVSGKLNEYGITTEKDSKITRRQTGVLRVNCMDCLDRTNVVESAAAGRALEQQLSEEGIELNLQADMSTSWFNSLWADNGDAVSKQYSSTAALKGDFTRTRKRDYRGALNDFGLTLSRYYNNIVNDYFSQTTIDFMLGNVGDDVFDEFEQNMQSSDPAEQLSMRRIRQTAIDNSSKIVIADETEDLVAGWTLLSPRTPNSVRPTTTGLEEVVLLLTDVALYSVRFDWTTEKVAGFERIAFKNITNVTRGTFITSVLSAAACDPNRNVGFFVRYKKGDEDDKKVNTRSMSTSAMGTADSFPLSPQAGESEGERQQRKLEQVNAEAESEHPAEAEKQTASDEQLLAFKALPSKAPGEASEGSTTPVMSELNTIKEVVDNVARLAKIEPQEAAVVSLAEARRATGLLEQLGHQLKMLVWGS